MKIALDATRINIPDGGGRYVNEMVKHLCLHFPEHDFFVIGPQPNTQHNYANLVHILYPEVDGIWARLQYAFSLSSLLRKYEVEIFHNLYNYGIYNPPCPVITTVHDLLTLKFPALRKQGFVQLLLYKFYVPHILKSASKIVAVSKSTADDLDELYHLNDRVEIVYNGCDSEKFTVEADNDHEVLKRYNLAPDYLLFVGYLVPKKNIKVIIHALALLGEKYNHYPKLVLVGKRGFQSEKVFSLIDTLQLTEQVIELGYVADYELAAIYRSAKLLVLPSFYEGFGLPVVEAMSCGTPALVSSCGSLPELLNNQDFTCSPDSPEQWGKKINKFFTDKEYYEASKGFAIRRSKYFSWGNCVKQNLQIYESVIKSIS